MGGGHSTEYVYVDRTPTIEQNIKIIQSKTDILNDQASKANARLREDQANEERRRDLELEAAKTEAAECIAFLTADIANKVQLTDAKVQQQREQAAALHRQRELLLASITAKEAQYATYAEELVQAEAKLEEAENGLLVQKKQLSDARKEAELQMRKEQEDLDHSLKVYADTANTDSSIKALVELLALLKMIPSGVTAAGSESKLMCTGIMTWIQELEDGNKRICKELDFVAKGTSILMSDDLPPDLFPLKDPNVLREIEKAGGLFKVAHNETKRARVVAASADNKEGVSEALDDYKKRVSQVERSVKSKLASFKSQCAVFTQFDIGKCIRQLENKAPQPTLITSQ